MFLLRCPNCKNSMKYQQIGQFSSGKRKRCVYCGKTFKVTDCILKKF
ncbi:MAG: hypothetical protein ABIF10_06680 [Candidatus Woesearchaeota archaeon]